MLAILIIFCVAFCCLAWFIVTVEREKKQGKEVGLEEIEVQMFGVFKVRISLEKNNKEKSPSYDKTENK